ncbi:hypothetical protein DXV75_06170 [Alteromonas aestuariivivens]|uniref:AlgX/AlgJ SGNH hydrolase-like domain-containing protein n=1 Tax=Alteromonas aestuariivivens TaxID=1938339 RepID=A0A3D8MA80_9ALTE|nr:hypothetical protein [Alteromonas aestuariivivens]RDV26578.1 hypothetical protein DXV75_06170 [Alteromonas aestuariivivens]
MATYTIKSKNLAPASFKGVTRWCIDEPTLNQEVDDQILEEFGLTVSGWILVEDPIKIQPVVLIENSIISLKFNRERPDVLVKILGINSENYSDVICGFSTSLSIDAPYFQVGVIFGGKFIALSEFHIEGSLKVLHGRDGWLFLDNDSNQSVEQYTGKIKLSRYERSAWKNYLNHQDQLKKTLGIHFCMLIAPSKEMVYSDYYPYSRARKTALDQLIDLAPLDFDLIIPIKTLRSSPKRSYRVCDTHWSHYGAMLASLDVVSCQKSDKEKIAKLFSSDTYRTRYVTGDLGNKVYPNQKHNEEFLSSFNHQHFVVFDNQLPNFGRIRVIYYKEAIYEDVLMVLGSSSSYTMFNYLSRVYKIIVFFHCAGNIDPEFIKSVNPNYVVTQSNARFIVKSPNANEDFRSYIKEKIDSLKCDEVPNKILRADIINSAGEARLEKIVGYVNSLYEDCTTKKRCKV